MLLNSKYRYGVIHVAIHWSMALVILGTFWLGHWMVDLDYYDPWYIDAPNLHRSVGMLVMLALLLRLVLRISAGMPLPVVTHARWERIAAECLHWGFYVLILAVGTTGYLISTADGRPVAVFDLVDIPATITGFEGQEDLAGEVHEVLATLLVVLASLHAAASLKHHFIDRDPTLTRMLGIGPGEQV